MPSHAPSRRKRYVTDGASMSYSGWHRGAAWVVNLLLYALLNVYILRIQTGLCFSQRNPYPPDQTLSDLLLAPLNIFYFPTYIIVIGLLMALLCIVPILVAQLYNLLYAVPFVLIVLFLGHNYIIALALLISAAAASFEPLRFKSKFVAALLCLIPEILYWIIFSGPNREANVLRWAVVYAPWGLAFLVSVVLFGLILAVGHFVRYRPGVIAPLVGLLLAGTVTLFHLTIGMTERDFQAYVYRYSPDQIDAFQSRSIVPFLEQETAACLKREPYLNPDNVKAQLRREWRQAFFSTRLGVPGSAASLAMREVIKFFVAKYNADERIAKFIDSYPSDPRVAEAIYYRALLKDVAVDLPTLRDEDTLRFYHDVPNEESEIYWRDLLDRFGEADVSVEARWRVARLLGASKPDAVTGDFYFDEALELLNEAKARAAALLEKHRSRAGNGSHNAGWFRDVFSKPPSGLTEADLVDLCQRIARLGRLIRPENRGPLRPHLERLADLVGLDPHQLDYGDRLQELLLNAPKSDPLIDNIELAQALLVNDADVRQGRLVDLAQRYHDCDAGVEAMFELAQLLIEKYRRSEHQGDRDSLRTAGIEWLQKVIALEPDTYLAQRAEEQLNVAFALP